MGQEFSSMMDYSCEFIRHGFSPVGVFNGLRHISGFNRGRDWVFCDKVKLLGLLDVVHGSSGHLVSAHGWINFW